LLGLFEMTRRAFYKRYPGDHIMGTRQLSLEERGAYSDLLDMMYDQGRAIPDDDTWISGWLGISARKWRSIREALLAAPNKLILRGDYLSNPRFERETGLEASHHEARVEWGRKGGKSRAAREKEAREIAAKAASPDLFGDNSANIGDKSEPPKPAQSDAELSRLSAEFDRFSALSGEELFGETKPEPAKINGLGQGNLKHARASHIPESRKKESDDSFLPRTKPKTAGASRIKSKRAAAIPKAFEPAPLSGDVAEIVAHWPPGMQEREFARFQDWAKGNGTTKKNWDATWRNWIRKADDDWKRAGARPLGKPSGWNFAERR
jgi:uncharacterized protein YdaU (DUF1376 family)